MLDESRAFIWLSELLEDPDILKPPQAIVPRLVWANRLTLLAAREKGGKSTLAGAAAAAVSSGQNFLGSPCVAGNVLVIAMEEHPQEFAQRFVHYGADPSNIAIIQGGANLISRIKTSCEEIEPSLIIWDTLGAIANQLAGKTLEPNDSQGWTEVMLQIVEIARDHGASLLLHHTKKSDGKYRDSTAIGANVDAIIEMYGEGNEPRTLKTVARFPTKEFRLSLEEEGFRVHESKEELEERVLAFISSHPRCTLKELRDGVPARGKEVSSARDRMLKDRRITNVGSGAAHSYMVVK